MITAEELERFKMEDGRRNRQAEFTESVQFKLRTDQLEALRRIREATKVPMAALLRDAVDSFLGKGGAL